MTIPIRTASPIVDQERDDWAVIDDDWSAEHVETLEREDNASDDEDDDEEAAFDDEDDAASQTDYTNISPASSTTPTNTAEQPGKITRIIRAAANQLGGVSITTYEAVVEDLLERIRTRDSKIKQQESNTVSLSEALTLKRCELEAAGNELCKMFKECQKSEAAARNANAETSKQIARNEELEAQIEMLETENEHLDSAACIASDEVSKQIARNEELEAKIEKLKTEHERLQAAAQSASDETSKQVARNQELEFRMEKLETEHKQSQVSARNASDEVSKYAAMNKELKAQVEKLKAYAVRLSTESFQFNSRHSRILQQNHDTLERQVMMLKAEKAQDMKMAQKHQDVHSDTLNRLCEVRLERVQLEKEVKKVKAERDDAYVEIKNAEKELDTCHDQLEFAKGQYDHLVPAYERCRQRLEAFAWFFPWAAEAEAEDIKETLYELQRDNQQA